VWPPDSPVQSMYLKRRRKREVDDFISNKKSVSLAKN
jgi:hypothetical protein